MPSSVAQVVAGAAAILLSTVLTVSARGVYRWGRRVEHLIRALHQHGETDDRILRELASVRIELAELRSEANPPAPPAVRRRHGGPVNPVRRQDPDG